jgi:hypothetical protein
LDGLVTLAEKALEPSHFGKESASNLERKLWGKNGEPWK